MNLPKFSIITVVLNGEAFLEDCIKSVVAQNYPHLEYIIIDGGSTDGTLDIINRYNSHISYWISEPDKGISNAFNKGLQRTTGDYIGILNADDWLQEQALEKVAAAFGTADIVYGNIKQIYDRDVYVAEANHHLLDFRMSLNHPAVFAKKTAYDKVGGFDENFKIAMDYEWLLRCKTMGLQFVYLPQVLTNMRMDGISNANWAKGLREVQAARKKYLHESTVSKTDYWKQYCATGLSVWLIGSPFASIFNGYRTRFSRIKKQKA